MRPGWLGQTLPVRRQLTQLERITGTLTGARRRLPRGEAQKAPESSTLRK